MWSEEQENNMARDQVKHYKAERTKKCSDSGKDFASLEVQGRICWDMEKEHSLWSHMAMKVQGFSKCKALSQLLLFWPPQIYIPI